MTDLTFGWFLPTSGDSTCLADPDQRIAQSPEMFEEVVAAADEGGFKYLLMPVNATCWEATVTASFYAARREKFRAADRDAVGLLQHFPVGQDVRHTRPTDLHHRQLRAARIPQMQS